MAKNAVTPAQAIAALAQLSPEELARLLGATLAPQKVRAEFSVQVNTGAGRQYGDVTILKAHPGKAPTPKLGIFAEDLSNLISELEIANAIVNPEPEVGGDEDE